KDLGPYLDQKISEVKAQSKIPLHYKRIGSIFWLAPGLDKEPTSYKDITKDTIQAFKEIYHYLLGKGIYLSPSVYEVAFLSLGHTKDDIDRLAQALKEF